MFYKNCEVCSKQIRDFQSHTSEHPSAFLLPCTHAICTGCRPSLKEFSGSVECSICRSWSHQNDIFLIPDRKICRARCSSIGCGWREGSMMCRDCDDILCIFCAGDHQSRMGHQITEVICPKCMLLRLRNWPGHVYGGASKMPVAVPPIRQFDFEAENQTVQLATAANVQEIKSQSLKFVNNINEVAEKVRQQTEVALALLKQKMFEGVDEELVMSRFFEMLKTLKMLKTAFLKDYSRLVNQSIWLQLRVQRVCYIATQVEVYENSIAQVLSCRYIEKALYKIREDVLNCTRRLARPVPEILVSFDSEVPINETVKWGRVKIRYGNGFLKEVLSLSLPSFGRGDLHRPLAKRPITSPSSSHLRDEPVTVSRITVTPEEEKAVRLRLRRNLKKEEMRLRDIRQTEIALEALALTQNSQWRQGVTDWQHIWDIVFKLDAPPDPHVRQTEGTKNSEADNGAENEMQRQQGREFEVGEALEQASRLITGERAENGVNPEMQRAMQDPSDPGTSSDHSPAFGLPSAAQSPSLSHAFRPVGPNQYPRIQAASPSNCRGSRSDDALVAKEIPQATEEGNDDLEIEPSAKRCRRSSSASFRV